MLRYTIVLLPAPDGGYVVHVPALNDTVTEGDTIGELTSASRTPETSSRTYQQ
jgi:predicted RNase H-like HicB family nuclease